MDTLDLFQRLGVALAIGLLIGLERGWQEREGARGSRTAGIRTFALVGLLGGLWGAMVPALGPVPLAAAALGFALVFAAFQWREAVAEGSFSVTSTIAGFIVFTAGAFAVLGDMAVAGAAGAATLALLASRRNLHELLKRMTWPELRSAVVILAMSFLALPILPNRTIDPWDAFNPFELWLMTVLIAVLAFAGYVAVRVMGERGLVVSAIAGSLVSSTSVTLVNSQLAAKSKGKESPLLAIAICVAWMTSLTRVTVIALGINPVLALPLLPAMAAALAVLALAVAFFARAAKGAKGAAQVAFDNPLDLVFVLKFGVLLAGITVAAKLASEAFGQAGLLGLAGVSGFVDVDPITLSAARLAGNGVTPLVAAQAILTACAANLVTKLVLPVAVGGWRFGVKLAMVGIAAILGGAGVWLIAANGA